MLGYQITFDSAVNRMRAWDSLAPDTIYSKVTHTVGEDEVGSDGVKALQFLKDKTQWFSSSNQVYEACKKGYVRLNDRKIYCTETILPGERLDIDLPSFRIDNKPAASSSTDAVYMNRLLSFTNSLLDVRNSNPPLSVLYEDDNVAVVFKPAGVHSLKWLGTRKKRFFSMDDLLPLILTAPDSERRNDSLTAMHRPLPCHRLDARVSGCLLVAKSYAALIHINRQFQTKSILKEYIAIVCGDMSRHVEILVAQLPGVIADRSLDGQSFHVCLPVNGRTAETVMTLLSVSNRASIMISVTHLLMLSFALLHTFCNFQVTPCNVYGHLTKVSLRPLTGRKHQLRQHCAALGTPIMGDDLYHDAAHVPLKAGRFDRIAQSGDLGSGDLQNTSEPYIDEHDVDLLSPIPPDMNPSTLTLPSGMPIDGVSPVVFFHRPTGQDDHLNYLGSGPPVRKGVGILLYSQSIDFEHPFPSSINPADLIMKSECCPDRSASATVTAAGEGGARLRVSVREPPKYSHLLLKAAKGATEQARRNAVAAAE